MTMRVASLLVVALTLRLAAQAPSVPPDTQIRLQRTSCLGTCPAYTVTVDADGLVTFEGERFVRVAGRQTFRVSRAAVARLLASVDRIKLFDLRDAYERDVTDLPTTFVTVIVNGRTKRIKDYDGAPSPLRDFEREIDAVAGTQRWIFFDQATLEELDQAGWSAANNEGFDFLSEAVRRDDTAIARRLLALGAPLSVSSQESASSQEPRIWPRVPPLYWVRSGAMVELLVRAGADPNERNPNNERTALMMAVFKDPAVIAALVKAGARLEEVTDGHTALYDAACSGRVQFVRILLAAGASPRGSTTTPAVDCARSVYAKEVEWRQRPGVRLEDRRPLSDFTNVIAMLESAQQKR